MRSTRISGCVLNRYTITMSNHARPFQSYHRSLLGYLKSQSNKYTYQSAHIMQDLRDSSDAAGAGKQKQRSQSRIGLDERDNHYGKKSEREREGRGKACRQVQRWLTPPFYSMHDERVMRPLPFSQARENALTPYYFLTHTHTAFCLL